MFTERLSYYELKLEEIKKEFEEYQKQPNFEKIKHIVEKCNIFENYNIKYLEELQKKEGGDEEEFRKSLEKFKDSIRPEILQSKFSIEKLCGKENIRASINRLISVSQMICKDEKTLLLEEIITFIEEMEKVTKSNFTTNFQLLPSDNLELYLNIINNIFCTKINKTLLVFSNKENINQNELDDIKEQYKKNEKSLQKDDEIIVKALKIMKNKHCFKYFNSLNDFLEGVNNNFSKRFKNKSFEDLNDLELLYKYIQFLSGYDFRNLDDYFIDLWNESLNEEQITEKYIKDNLEILNKDNVRLNIKVTFTLENNNIKVTTKQNTFVISDINIYSFKALYKYLRQIKRNFYVNYFDLLYFVKIQYFNEYIRSKIITENWRDFYYQIFESNVIKSLLVELFGLNIENYEFKKIFDSIQFYNFDGIDFMGETTDLGIFVSGTMGLKENKMLNNFYKIKFYTKIFETILHEILGHEMIKIQQDLVNKQIQSPETKGEKYSRLANARGKESGEFVLIKLFGEKFKILMLGEICFIFDLSNYAIENLNTFTEKFSKSSKEVDVNIPEIIKDIVKDNGKELVIINIVDQNSKRYGFSINLYDEEEKLCSSAYLKDLNNWDNFANKFIK